MAIQPLNIAASELRVPQVDLSSIANLYTNYQKSRANAFALDEAEKKRAAYAGIGKLSDLQEIGRQILPYDPAAGAALIKQGQEQAQAAAFSKLYGGTLSGGGAAPAAPAAAAPAVTPPAPKVGPQASLFDAKPGAGVPMFAQADNLQAPVQTGFVAASGRPKVSFAGVDPALSDGLNIVGQRLGKPLEITSARDSQHTTGSQHYVGKAVDIRNRNMTPGEQARVVAELKNQGFNVLIEGDHIHASIPRGGQPGQPGTVLASMQRPTAGGGPAPSTMATAPAARTQVAALDPRFTPQTSMTDAGPQLPVGVSPAAAAALVPPPVAAAGQPQQQAPMPVLPPPAPLTPPPVAMNLAALAGNPTGQGGPMLQMPTVGRQASQLGPGVQVAQAGGGAPPLPPQRPVASVAPPAAVPAVAPPVAAPPALQARGATSGSPLEQATDRQLLGMVLHPGAPTAARELAKAEIARRSEINKPSSDYGDYQRAKSEGWKGGFADWQQLKTKQAGDIEKFEYAVKRGDFKGTFPEWMEKHGGPQRLTIDQKAQSAEEVGLAEHFVKRVTHASEAAETAQKTLADIGALRELGVQTGPQAAAKAWLAERGVKLDGSSEAEAYTAIIDRMTPAQRIPGAGATSDFDARMFRSALPSLMRSGLANEIIMNTYEKLAQNHAARGDLANRLMAKEIDKPTFLKELNQLGRDAHKIGADAVREARETTAKRGEAPQVSPDTPARADDYFPRR